MKIIGIAGLAGSGKDTAYTLLSEYFSSKGLVSQKLSFARTIKDMCTLMYGWDRTRLDFDSVYKEGRTLDNGDPDPACTMLGLTRREVMQKIGTEAFRDNIHKDHWVIVTKLAIMNGHYSGVDIGFITDCRFLNELEFVRSMNGVLLQVQRGGDQSTLTEYSQHLSEIEWRQWKNWDVIVENHIDPHRTMQQNLTRFKSELVRGVEVAFEGAKA